MNTKPTMQTTTHDGTPGADHAHHWLIEEAHGPTGRGICKICGATKVFKNWLEEGDFLTNEEHRQAA